MSKIWSKMRIFIGFIIIGSILFSTLKCPTASASDITIGTASLGVTIDQEHQQVDVSPGSNCIAHFTGNISYSYSYQMMIYVSAKIENNPGGWKVAVTPTKAKQSGNGTMPFTLDVHAPPETSNSVPGVVVVVDVEGMPYGWAEPYITGHETCMVSVKPFYKLSIECVTPYQQMAPNTETYFNIYIVNLGNSNDIYGVEITNRDEIKGWIIQEKFSSIYIPEKSIANIPIMVVAPYGWTLWEDKILKIDIKVTSVTSENTEEVSEDFNIYVRQRGTYIPGFDPTFMIITLGIMAIVLRRMRKC